MTAIHPDVQATIDANGLGSLPWVMLPNYINPTATAVLGRAFSLMAVIDKRGPMLVLDVNRSALKTIGPGFVTASVRNTHGALTHLGRVDDDQAREAAAVIRAAMAQAK